MTLRAQFVAFVGLLHVVAFSARINFRECGALSLSLGHHRRQFDVSGCVRILAQVPFWFTPQVKDRVVICHSNISANGPTILQQQQHKREQEHHQSGTKSKSNTHVTNSRDVETFWLPSGVVAACLRSDHTDRASLQKNICDNTSEEAKSVHKTREVMKRKNRQDLSGKCRMLHRKHQEK